MNLKDLRIGALLVAFGLFFGVFAYLKITIGTAARMGPGFFPIVLSVLLVALGVLICVRSLGAPASPSAAPSLRGLVLILLAPIFFGLTVRGLGFAPAVAGTVLLSAAASRRMSVRQAALIAATLTGVCIAIFHYAIGVPVELIGPWLRP